MATATKAMKGIFAKVGNAKTRERGIRLEAGEYPSLTLSKFYLFTGFGEKETGIAEVIVNESRATPECANPAPVGSKRTVIFSFEDAYGYGHGRLKSFVLALFPPVPEAQQDEEQIGRDTFDLLADDDNWKNAGNTGPSPKETQPLRGKLLAGYGAVARKKGDVVMGKDGTPTVNYTWRFVDQDEAGIAAKRAELDKAGV